MSHCEDVPHGISFVRNPPSPVIMDEGRGLTTESPLKDPTCHHNCIGHSVSNMCTWGHMGVTVVSKGDSGACVSLSEPSATGRERPGDISVSLRGRVSSRLFWKDFHSQESREELGRCSLRIRWPAFMGHPGTDVRASKEEGTKGLGPLFLACQSSVEGMRMGALVQGVGGHLPCRQSCY